MPTIAVLLDASLQELVAICQVAHFSRPAVGVFDGFPVMRKIDLSAAAVSPGRYLGAREGRVHVD